MSDTEISRNTHAIPPTVQVAAYDEPGDFCIAISAVVPEAQLSWLPDWPPQASELEAMDVLFVSDRTLDAPTLVTLRAAYPSLKIMLVVRKRLGTELVTMLNDGLHGFVRVALGRHAIGQQIRVLLARMAPAAMRTVR